MAGLRGPTSSSPLRSPGSVSPPAQQRHVRGARCPGPGAPPRCPEAVLRGQRRRWAPKRPAESCSRGQWERSGHLTKRSQPPSAPGPPAAPGLRRLGQGSRSGRRWDPGHLGWPSGWGTCVFKEAPLDRQRAGPRRDGRGTGHKPKRVGRVLAFLPSPGSGFSDRSSRGPQAGRELVSRDELAQRPPTNARAGWGSRGSEGRTKWTRAPAPSGAPRVRGQASAGFLPRRGAPPRFRPDEPQASSPGTSNCMQMGSQQSAGSCPGPPASRRWLWAAAQSPRPAAGSSASSGQFEAWSGLARDVEGD